MSAPLPQRNYSLAGPENERAQGRGLATAAWYASPIPRARLKELMRRRAGPALRDTLLWFALIIGTGLAGALTWGTWWCVPAFLAYGVLYGSSSDSRWHECGHGTAFKTSWMNEVVYRIASFMVLREPGMWRWSHARHHTDTIIVGRDPEIAVPRPPNLLALCAQFFGLVSGPRELRRIVRHCFGRMRPEEKDYVPASECPKVFRTARVFALIFAATIGLAIASRSLLPLLLVGLPSFYGAWLMQVFGLTQHAGLAEDVLDHRLNCRTVYTNRVFRYLYWNMNYHVEHHMYPLVPYHALPALHEALKADMPPAYPGLWAAYREIIPALLRQVRDPSYQVIRPLPALEAGPALQGAAA
jgi:fatty acid desaturase